MTENKGKYVYWLLDNESDILKELYGNFLSDYYRMSSIEDCGDNFIDNSNASDVIETKLRRPIFGQIQKGF
jgi:hypothetical protein